MKSVCILSFACLSTVSVAGDKKISPMDIAGAKTVTAQEAKALFDKGVAFIDVRKDKDWQAGRIPDAIHINLKTNYSKDSLSKEVKMDEKIVIYCNGETCMRSSKASAKAVDWGFKNVFYFRDGFPAWKKNGYPVE